MYHNNYVFWKMNNHYIRFRQTSLAFLCVWIVIELFVLLHKMQVFKSYVHDMKLGQNMPMIEGSFIYTGNALPCNIPKDWYLLTSHNCLELSPGEEYGYIGSAVNATDTFFYKQIRLDIQGKLQIKKTESSLKYWFGYFYRFRAHTRENITQILSEHLTINQSALVEGLIFGDDSSFTRSFKKSIKSAGLQHVMAASGYNVSLMLSVVTPFWKIVWPRRSHQFFILISIWFGIWMAYASPSLLRAGMSCTWQLLSVYTGRPIKAWWATTLAVLTLISLNVYLWWSISFQLSVAATVGILIWSSRQDHNSLTWLGMLSEERIQQNTLISSSFYNKVITTLRKYLLENLTLTWSALSLVAPLLLFHFKSLGISSFYSSLGITWLIPAASLSSLLNLFLSVLNSPDSVIWKIIAFFSTVPLDVFISLVELISQLTIANWEIQGFSSLSVFISWFFIIMICGIFMKWRHKNRYFMQNYE